MGRRAPVIVTQPMVRRRCAPAASSSTSPPTPAATAPPPCRASASSRRTASPILGYHNWPGRIPVAASSLYARNLLTFLSTFWDKEAKAPKLPENDDIVKGVMLTRGGAVVHPHFLPSQAA